MEIKTGADLGIPKKHWVVAIDGPAGTGKSTVTKRLATLLGLTHVDTGALYRAIAYLSLQARGTRSAEQIAREAHLEFKQDPSRNPAQRIFANGLDVTEFIRTPELSMEASRISALPQVRAALLGLQRRLGCAQPSILEGRDIGTVVFPDADIKFFLTASIEERAKRRWIELDALGGDSPSFEELKKQIEERDRGDSSRAVAPLKPASDSIHVDTTALTLDGVVQTLATQIRERLGRM